MEKKFLKKIIAQSPRDLQMISALCSEAKIKLSDMKYLAKNKIFLISLERVNKENSNKNEKINSVIKFEFIDSSKSKNIDQNNLNEIIKLIAINLIKKKYKY